MLYNWWLHTHFAYPWLLPGLLVIPYLIYWYTKSYKEQHASFQVTTTFFLKKTVSWRAKIWHLPFVLRCLTLFCLIVAMARPQASFEEEISKGKGIDIVLCFDISGSMTEQDFVPNRLEAAKQVATDFVKNRKGDRIGVVIFSGKSFTLCPITTDHEAVQQQINHIQNGYLGEDGTAIGSGLATSIDRLKASTATSKVVVLLTDGVDFGGAIPPDIALQMAKTFGIKIYTIGIGTQKDIALDQLATEPTNINRYGYNEALLETLAKETGGQYFKASDKQKLGHIYQTINQLEKSDITITTYTRFSEKFEPFVWCALMFLLVELLLRLVVLKKIP